MAELLADVANSIQPGAPGIPSVGGQCSRNVESEGTGGEPDYCGPTPQALRVRGVHLPAHVQPDQLPAETMREILGVDPCQAIKNVTRGYLRSSCIQRS